MTPAREQLVIVGAGMAAGRLTERLVEHGYPGEITLVGDEPVAAYNRVLLPGFLAGSCSLQTLAGRPAGWFDECGVHTRLGRAAVNVDALRREVRLDDGSVVAFDRLVLATGARAPTMDVPGNGLAGVTTLRSLADAERLRTFAASGRSAVVVGGGLLGLETAQSLLDLGLDVHVVHRRPALMNRQLDDTAAGMLARALSRRGMVLHLGETVAAIHGAEQVTAVTLGSGARLPAGAVVFATGTRPNDELATKAGLTCDHGVVVDVRLRTSHDGIFALGECARPPGGSYALVEPVFRQADVLARVLCGENARFVPPPPATRLKVSGIELFSAGDVSSADSVCIRDPARGLYRNLMFRRRRLVGAVLLGDISGSQHIQSLIGAGSPLPPGGNGRADVAFGIHDPMQS